jgi:hypothetical protein
MALPVPPTQRGKAVAAPTNQADKLWVKFRARNLLSSAATGNEEFAQLVAKMIQTNAACTNFFEPKESTLTNKLDQVGVDAVDYGFEMLLKLKRPIPLDSKRPAGAFAGGLPGQ